MRTIITPTIQQPASPLEESTATSGDALGLLGGQVNRATIADPTESGGGSPGEGIGEIVAQNLTTDDRLERWRSLTVTQDELLTLPAHASITPRMHSLMTAGGRP